MKVPRQARAAGRARRAPAAVDSAEPAVWAPPSEPRQPRDADEPCRKCRGVVKITPGGTVRWCPACNTIVTPPGVLAPYERSGTEVTRAARSQRERDDDAKKTVLIAGEFLRQVRALLDDPQIHPASADLLGWYEEEITEARKARDGRRLAELAGEFSADREARAFRRRHWWQGQPAALTAADDDDGQDDEDGYAVHGEVVDDQDDEPAALAAPAGITARQQHARPGRATWAEAFAAHGWRLTPAGGDGRCQVEERHGHCPDPTGGHPPVSDSLTPTGWVCSAHYYALGAAITEINRSRGIT